ncbi:Helix-turn-helix protein [Labrenzia sp. THAF82]|uniref:helix-turn-helix domain-containing protein n=1 Tax=Labrenzia sp. THAF82 TaxID=2587861 RepID=UPI0012AA1E86|nr:helix-turn-helix transcriptional regulator [Labrenzia sp. THAF82]QFT29519.1 Helix-turn-helix protein [Labrenzia sp. THAF82]
MSVSTGPKKTISLDKHIGMRIRTARVQAGFTQKTLAAKLEITYQQLQKYEAGVNRIAASRIATVARILDEPISYFFDGAPNVALKSLCSPEEAIRQKRLLKHEDAIELVQAFNQITTLARRRLALTIVKELASVP